MAFSSCAARLSAPLTEKGGYPLLGPEYLERPMDEAQEITGVYNGAALTMQAWVLADETSLTIAFFDLFGVSLGEVSFTANKAVMTSRALPSALKAEYIIADFQLCFYKAGALSRALKAGGFLLRETKNLDPQGNPVETRAVFETRGDTTKPVILIEKTRNQVTYTNHLRGYAFSIVAFKDVSP